MRRKPLSGKGSRETLQWSRHAYHPLLFEPVKRLFVVVFLVLASSVAYRFYGSPETGTGSLTLPQPAPSAGEEAPTFEVARRDGGEFELSDKGTYMLTFWSTLNEDTADARPMFGQLAHDYEDRGVSFAAVYVSHAPEGEKDVPYAVLQDDTGELTALYNVKRVPRLFLIENGTIELVQNGYYPENEERLREELDRILPPET
jgi:thiol-disulfide isomerase/thioredoxin